MDQSRWWVRSREQGWVNSGERQGVVLEVARNDLFQPFPLLGDCRRSRQAIFDWVRRLHGEGKTVSDIVRQTGFDRRTIAKWIRLDALPDRNASALKTSSPRYFEEYLSRRWAERCVRGRQLFREVKARGYTGSFSNLERLLAKWRCPTRHLARPAPAVAAVRTTDP
jgi:hypothetical protein